MEGTPDLDFSLDAELARRFDIAALRETRGWKALCDSVNKKRENLNKVLVAKLLEGEPAIQREIDYYRGFLAGMSAVEKLPDIAWHAYQKGDAKRRAHEGSSS